MKQWRYLFHSHILERGLNYYEEGCVTSLKQTFDIESLIDSELGESLVKNMEYFLKGYDEMDPEVVKHWKNMGIKKRTA